jgi:hypothetical protein
MRTHLTAEHYARITAPGWDAVPYFWSREQADFSLHGRHCSLVRQGSGFIPTLDRKPLSEIPEYPDAALAIIWRAVHN